MSETSNRPRDRRIKNPSPIRLTERDLAILQALDAYRVLTTEQVQELLFSNIRVTSTAMKKARARLQLLYHHGLVDRKFLGLYFDKMNTPILYVLDRRGAEILHNSGKLSHTWKRKSKQVGLFFLQHTIAINDVRIAVIKATQKLGFELLEWKTENELKLGYDHVRVPGIAEPIAVIPDSYFSLRTPNGIMHFFLEVDRSTESNKTFKRKIAAYQVYCGSEEAKQRFGANKFRILTVTTNKARLKNLKLSTEACGGKSRFWFTTTAEISAETVLREPIWNIADRNEQAALVAVT